MKYSVTLVLLSASFGAFGAGNAKTDSERVNALLTDAKAEAMALQTDAGELDAYTRSSDLWQTHAAKLEQMKQHVNKTGQLLQELNNNRSEASPWQEIAINRLTPPLREMADNLTATINCLNKNQSHLRTGPYTDFARANYDLAANLAETVSDFSKYGHTKSNYERLAQKLELPER